MKAWRIGPKYMAWKTGKWKQFAPSLVALRSLIGWVWRIRAAVLGFLGVGLSGDLRGSALIEFGGKNFQKLNESYFEMKMKNYESSSI